MTSPAKHSAKRPRPRLTARYISITSALCVDAGLVWLYLACPDYRPDPFETERFWVWLIASFGTYAVLQQWSLASQTSRGDDLWAAVDKFVSASPLIVVAVLEAYWLGARGIGALGWRHHAVGLLWSAFSLTDFLATDITNQRLKARQVNVAEGS